MKRLNKQPKQREFVVCCDRLLLARVQQTFAFASHKIFLVRLFLRPLACSARGQLPPFPAGPTETIARPLPSRIANN